MSLFASSGANASVSTAVDEPALLTTPFEDWCESSGVHPEAPFAWERFQATLDPRAATVGEV